MIASNPITFPLIIAFETSFRREKIFKMNTKNQLKPTYSNYNGFLLPKDFSIPGVAY